MGERAGTAAVHTVGYTVVPIVVGVVLVVGALRHRQARLRPYRAVVTR